MKRFLTVLLLLTLALTTCDNGKDTHTHEWGAWQSDATQHWKECTAEGQGVFGVRCNATVSGAPNGVRAAGYFCLPAIPKSGILEARGKHGKRIR